MKKIISILLAVACVIVCAGCGKNEPQIEPSVTVNEVLQELEKSGYTVKSINNRYRVPEVDCEFGLDTNDKNFVNLVLFESKKFETDQKDLLKTIWNKLLDDKVLIGEIVYDLCSEEYLKNGIASNIERGNLSIRYFTTEKINSDSNSTRNTYYSVSLEINANN